MEHVPDVLFDLGRVAPRPLAFARPFQVSQVGFLRGSSGPHRISNLLFVEMTKFGANIDEPLIGAAQLTIHS